MTVSRSFTRVPHSPWLVLDTCSKRFTVR